MDSAAKPDPVIVQTPKELPAGSSGDDSEAEDLLAFAAGDGEGSLTAVETLLIVGVAVLASSTITVILVKVTKCCGRSEARVIHRKDGLRAHEIGDSDHSHYGSHQVLPSMPLGGLGHASTHNSHRILPNLENSILGSDGEATSMRGPDNPARFDEQKLM